MQNLLNSLSTVKMFSREMKTAGGTPVCCIECKLSAIQC